MNFDETCFPLERIEKFKLDYFKNHILLTLIISLVISTFVFIFMNYFIAKIFSIIENKNETKSKLKAEDVQINSLLIAAFPILYMKYHFAFALSITITFLPFYAIELKNNLKTLFWYTLFFISLFAQYSYPFF